MTIFSKYEYKILQNLIRNRQACDLGHTGSCFKQIINILPGIIYSNGKYFIPMVILQILMNIKKVNKKLFVNAFNYYLGLVFTGSTVGYLAVALHCAFRNLLGSYIPGTVIFSPAYLASLVILKTGHKKAMKLFLTSTFQGLVETLLIHRSNILTKSVYSSMPLQTLCFMLFSAIILHAKQNNLYKGFWFVQPAPKLLKNSEGICMHTNVQDCRQYWLKGLRINAAIGLTLDIFRALTSVSKNRKNNLFSQILWKLADTKFKMTAFLPSYVLIYRFLNCILPQKLQDTSPEVNHFLAAALGGLSYKLYPNRSILVYAFVISCQIIWSQFQTNPDVEKHKFLKILRDSPLIWIIFPGTLAYLTHTYLFHNEVSKLSQDMINNLTNNYGKQVSLRLKKLVKDEISSMAKSAV